MANDTRLHDIGVAYVNLDDNNDVKFIACTVVLGFEERRVLLFPNKRKEKESQPHYRVSIEVEKRSNGNGNSGNKSGGGKTPY